MYVMGIPLTDWERLPREVRAFHIATHTAHNALSAIAQHDAIEDAKNRPKAPPRKR